MVDIFDRAEWLLKKGGVQLVDITEGEAGMLYEFKCNGKYETELKLIDMGDGTVDRHWNCTCENTIWKGAKSNRECYHVYACIAYLVLMRRLKNANKGE